ncbi:hypothetical protein AB0F72_21470 [Actinoplanes sp. NPDC023936]|uniref:hypothetical protein n=1 Tax=Actinoplanes sp. NPDC023936 TaxID=3154910 RepID=UPI003411C6FA
MADPYRIADPSPAEPRPNRGVLRPALWLLLILSAAANAVTSSMNVVVGAVFGLVAITCATVLAVHHYRSR